MIDSNAKTHTKTYNLLADEYEQRVNKQWAVTAYALAYLTKELEPGAKVLDVGCAVGYTTQILRESGMDAEGIDIADAMIAYAQQRNPHSKFVVGDFLAEPYPTGTYDAILMYAFIHLFPYDQAALYVQKAVDLLKPGGFLFIGTTKSAESSEGFEAKNDYSKTAQRFRKRWTPSELKELLDHKKLEVTYHEDITDEFGKVWMDFVTRKP